MFSCQHIYATASTAQQQSKAILLLTEGLKMRFQPFLTPSHHCKLLNEILKWLSQNVWLGGREATQVRILASPLLSATLSKLTHVRLSPSSIICGWEGNRSSGVTLATRQILVVLHLRGQGLGEGDEHPPTLS